MVQLSSLLFEHAKVLEPCHPLSYRSAATVTADIRALVQGLVDRVAKLEETNRNNVAIAGLECKELYESLRLSRERVAKLEALQTRNLAVLDQQRAAASAAVDVALAQQKRIADLEAELEATRAERDEYKRSKGTTYFTSDKEAPL